LTGKTFAQSEPDIISAVAARKAKRGIAAQSNSDLFVGLVDLRPNGSTDFASTAS